MSSKAEKLDKWHFAQSLLKKKQIIESTTKKEKGDRGIKQATKPFRKCHTRSPVLSSFNLPGSLPNKAVPVY